MKPSNPPAQRDLFNSAASPPMVTTLQQRHDELVELLSQLLWEAAAITDQPTSREDGNE